MSLSAPIGEAQEELTPNSRLGPYELLGEWARGGMGALWAARNVETGQILGVKTLLSNFAAEHHFRWSFIDEASLASRIQHPNVARVFGAGEDRGHLYCVMELIRGDSLRVLQRDAQAKSVPLPPRLLASIILNACAGLHAAHELRGEDGALLGVVHRDISPHNILVGTDGSVKLIDFGIAKAKDRLAADTSTGLIKGKIDYMAPEQVNLSKTLDRRTDVFCMGATLYSMLAGKPPYDSGDGGQIVTLSKLIEGAPIPPLPASVPRPIVSVVLKALEHEPAKRFATAREMGEALDQALSTLGSRASQSEIGALVSGLLEDRLVIREGRVFSSIQSTSSSSEVHGGLVQAGQSHVRPRAEVKQTTAFFSAVTIAVASGALLVAVGLRGARTLNTESRQADTIVRGYRAQGGTMAVPMPILSNPGPFIAPPIPGPPGPSGPQQGPQLHPTSKPHSSQQTTVKPPGTGKPLDQDGL